LAAIWLRPPALQITMNLLPCVKFLQVQRNFIEPHVLDAGEAGDFQLPVLAHVQQAGSLAGVQALLQFRNRGLWRKRHGFRTGKGSGRGACSMVSSDVSNKVVRTNPSLPRRSIRRACITGPDPVTANRRPPHLQGALVARIPQIGSEAVSTTAS